ncbi:2-alkenal reductase (NADP(+)-dependent)-like isoform X2 [Ziziphus jujuba]|uniref:2-alkenal reductase (NADP(+)-dependent)-like isoform X2 n=1 Tax=Ziziphus jujuba TaxID=326968 RepID=A0ABM3ZZJ5_ZIZJJ|nr:2-alkenal reductase (NADP(+)-dependent)-like isoform X2 [Ziziphus jujuba]
MEVSNNYITMKGHIDGKPKEDDFGIKASQLSLSVEPGSNHIIVKNLYVSIDPFQINRMKSFSSLQESAKFAPDLTPDKVIDAYGVGKVVASGNTDFEKDDLVVGLLIWGEYSVLKGEYWLSKLDPMGFPLSYHVGILGMSGLTAYSGFFEVCKPKKGEKVFVSAASGSVGNLVGQYAKLFGCHVVGCAGSKEKVAFLKEKLGFDDAFNYKEVTDLKATLKSSGVIAEYTDAGKRAAPNMLDVVYKSITIQGFLLGDYFHIFQDFVTTTSDHLRAGNMQAIECISTGLNSIPQAFIGLFRGDNIGKTIVKIADE